MIPCIMNSKVKYGLTLRVTMQQYTQATVKFNTGRCSSSLKQKYEHTKDMNKKKTHTHTHTQKKKKKKKNQPKKKKKNKKNRLGLNEWLPYNKQRRSCVPCAGPGTILPKEKENIKHKLTKVK